MSTQKQILFVDDDPMLLAGLKRSLHSMREYWRMSFLDSGEAALRAMEEHPFDAVVTDMRMPHMNGAQLLEIVKHRFPNCLRMVFSGQADRDTILSVVEPTHQFLAKPCERDDLKSRLERAFATQELLQNPNLKELVSKLDSLPNLPALYLELTSELGKDEPSVLRFPRNLDNALNKKYAGRRKGSNCPHQSAQDILWINSAPLGRRAFFT